VVERGPQQDSGFVPLFTAGPQDSTFLDATVKPMSRYYYRLRLVGPGGVLSPSSAVIIGTYKSSNEPAPPLGVTATSIRHGVQISWLGENTQDIEGYYVYRGNGIGDPLFPITPLLPPTSTHYIDTSDGLRGGYAYTYAIQCISTSHIPSRLSDTATAIPDISIPVSSPLGVRAIVEGDHITVLWNVQRNRDAGLAGFRVFRSEKGSNLWKTLSDTLLPAWQNFLQDTHAELGPRYHYAVRAYTISGDSSALSMAVVAQLQTPQVFPPSNLQARVERRGVRLTWNEIAQPAARGINVYRYTRGKKPVLLSTVKQTETDYHDAKPGSDSPVFYFLKCTTVNGAESVPGNEAAVILQR
jgi:hypothetical protein